MLIWVSSPTINPSIWCKRMSHLWLLCLHLPSVFFVLSHSVLQSQGVQERTTDLMEKPLVIRVESTPEATAAFYWSTGACRPVLGQPSSRPQSKKTDEGTDILPAQISVPSAYRLGAPVSTEKTEPRMLLLLSSQYSDAGSESPLPPLPFWMWLLGKSLELICWGPQSWAFGLELQYYIPLCIRI